ncbi:MAG: InlB B-repeat-containing protein, partial [Clostridia bacterium]|nr:InlB B-repeat-containing protein [Clostridia bacterium]
TAISYKVTFDKNGATGSMSDQSLEYDKEGNLTANGFTKTGYTFSGWKVSATNLSTSTAKWGASSATSQVTTSTVISNSAKVKNLTTKNGAIITLTAQWKAITYKIQFAGNGNTGGSMSVINCTYDQVKQLTKNAYVKTGYSFAGWKVTSNLNTDTAKWGVNSSTSSKVETVIAEQKSDTNPDISDSLYVKNLTASKDATVILTAQWEANTYKITYASFNSKGSYDKNNPSTSVQSVVFDSTYQVKKPSDLGWNKSGTFVGWSLSKDDSSHVYKYTAAQTGINLKWDTPNDIKVYAVWNFTITYMTKVTVNDVIVNIAAIDRLVFTTCKNKVSSEYATVNHTGYIYNGWSTSEKPTSGAKRNDEITGSMTLYPYLTPITYNISFNGNGNTGGSMTNLPLNFDKSLQLTNGFVRTGYNFTGWKVSGFNASTAKYGNSPNPTTALNTNTVIANGSYIKNLTATNGATVTITAQWKAITYYIKLKPEGGLGTGINCNNGTVGVTDGTATYDIVVNITNPTRTGYTFYGWKAEASNLNTSTAKWGTSATTVSSQVTISNPIGKDNASTFVKNLSSSENKTVTLVAQWKANLYNVSIISIENKFFGAGGESVTLKGINPHNSFADSVNISIDSYKTKNDHLKDGNNLTLNQGVYAETGSIGKIEGYIFQSKKSEQQLYFASKFANITLSNSIGLGTVYKGYIFRGWSTDPSADRKKNHNAEITLNQLSTDNTLNIYLIWDLVEYNISIYSSTSEVVSKDKYNSITTNKQLDFSSAKRFGYHIAGLYLIDRTPSTPLNHSTVTPGHDCGSYRQAFVSSNVFGGFSTEGFNNFVGIDGKKYSGKYIKLGQSNSYVNVKSTGQIVFTPNGLSGCIDIGIVWEANQYNIKIYKAEGSNVTLKDLSGKEIKKTIYFNQKIDNGTDLVTSISKEIIKKNNVVGVGYFFKGIYAKGLSYKEDGSNNIVDSSDIYFYNRSSNLDDTALFNNSYLNKLWAYSYSNIEDSNNLNSNPIEIKFYCKVEALTYIFTFDPNGGAAKEVGTKEGSYDAQVSFGINPFKRVGYHTKTTGTWSLLANGSNYLYNSAQSYTISDIVNAIETNNANPNKTKIVVRDHESDASKKYVTVYAQWGVNTYTLNFNATGASGTAYTMTYAYDKVFSTSSPLTITDGGYRKTGYSIVSWKSSTSNTTLPVGYKHTSAFSDFLKTYVVNNIANEASDESSFSYTLNANFEPNKINLYFGLGDYSPTTVTLVNFVNDTNNWIKNADKFTYALEGQKLRITIAYDQKPFDSFVLNPKRKGYNFVRWVLRDSPTVTFSLQDILKFTDKNVYIDAVWEGITYYITYSNAVVASANNDIKYGGGTTVSGSGVSAQGKITKSFVYSDNGRLTIDNPNSYFQFTGYHTNSWVWKTDVNDADNANLISGNSLKIADFVDKYYASFKEGETPTIELIVKWEVNTYTVVYNSVNKDGSLSGDFYKNNNNTIVGKKVTYTGINYFATPNFIEVASKFTGNTSTGIDYYIYLKGYNFKGWTLDDGKLYSYNDKYTTLTPEHEGVVNIYAVWEIKTLNMDITLSHITIDKIEVYDDGTKISYNSTTSSDGRYKFDIQYNSKVQVIVKGADDGYYFSNFTSSLDKNSYTVLNNSMSYTMPNFDNGEIVTVSAYAIPNKYYVRYHNFDTDEVLKLKDNTNAVQQMTYDTSANLIAYSQFKDLVRVGYRFAGWSTTKNATVSQINFTDSENVKNLTITKDGYYDLYVVWIPVEYKITYDLNGSNSNFSNSESANLPYDKTFTTRSVDFAKDGYHFLYWATTNNLDKVAYTTYSANATYNVADLINFFVSNNLLTDADLQDKGITLYAIWEPNTYYVDFYSEGTLLGTQEFTYDAPQNLYTFEFLKAEKEGHLPKYWYSNDAKTFTDGENVKNLTIVQDGHYDLNIFWEIQSYKFTFDDSSVGITFKSISSDKYNNVSAVQPDGSYKVVYATDIVITFEIAIGYKLNSIYLDSSDVNLIVSSETTRTLKMPAKAVHMTLKADPIVYSVRFYGNNGKYNNTETVYVQKDFVYDEAKDLEPPEFKYYGYSLQGWAYDATSETASFAINENVINLSTVDGSIVDLYAVWKADNYKVYFKADDENVAFMDTSALKKEISQDIYNDLWYKEVTFDSPYGTLPVVSRKGYQFDGWYHEDVLISSSTVLKLAEKHILVAKWKPNTYTVTYFGNGGTIGEGSAVNSYVQKDFVYDVEKNLMTNEEIGFYNKGKNFVGWSIDSGVTVLEFIIDGVSHFNPGHTVKNLTDVNGGNFVLYAVWKEIVYNLHYIYGDDTTDENGETEIVVDIVYDKFFTTLDYRGLTRTGYHLVHWNFATPTKQDNGDYTYSDNYYSYATTYSVTEFISDLESVDRNLISGNPENPDIYLYGVWARNPYKIYYNPNGGTGTIQEQDYLYLDTKNLLDRKNVLLYTRQGYRFLGWSEDSSATEPTYQDKESYYYGIDKDLYLFAIWTPLVYTITFDVNGANAEYSNTTTQKSYIEEFRTRSSSEIARTGYTFDTWNTTSDGTGYKYIDSENYSVKALVDYLIDNGTLTDPETSVEITLYAIWKENYYTISFDGNKADGGTGLSSQVVTYTQAYKLEKNGFTRQGYDFVGWSMNKDTTYDDISNIIEDEAIVSMLTSEPDGHVVLHAIWEPRNDTNFNIEVYFEDFDGMFILDNTRTVNFIIESTFDGFDLTTIVANSELGIYNGQSRTESIITITAGDEDYVGYDFVSDYSVTEAEVVGVGTATLKVYYKLESHYLTLVGSVGVASIGAGGAANQITAYSSDVENKEYVYLVKYGSSISVNVVIHIGYLFNGWISTDLTVYDPTDDNALITKENLNYGFNFTMGNDDLRIDAPTEPRTDIEYKVYHMFETLDGRSYDQQVEEFEDGTTDTMVTAEAWTGDKITGFTYSDELSKDTKTQKINGDGTTVMYLYYTRNWYNVRLDKVNENNIRGVKTFSASADSPNYINDITMDFTGLDENTIIYSVKFGATLTLRGENDKGYDIAWYVKDSSDVYQKIDLTTFVMEAGDLYTKIIGTPRNDTIYYISYYTENLDGSYSLQEKLENQGTTDTDTTADASINRYTDAQYFLNTELCVGYDETTGTIHGNISGETPLELKVYFKRNEYTLSFTLGLGIVSISASGSGVKQDLNDINDPNIFARYIVKNGAKIALAYIEQKGYTFKEWTSNVTVTFEGNNVVMPTSDMTITGVGRPNVYNIIYNGNGNQSGTVANTVATYDADVTFAKNEFLKKGHTFLYWNTKADGTGITFEAETCYEKPNLCYLDNDNITLYAIWKVNRYDIYYYLNKESATNKLTDCANKLSEKTQNIEYNSNVRLNTIDEIGFEILGHSIVEWEAYYYDKDSGRIEERVVDVNGVELTLSSVGASFIYDFDRHMVFKAIWEVNVYKIKFDGNGGTTNENEGSYTQDIRFNERTNLEINKFSRAGYDFVGWYYEILQADDSRIMKQVEDASGYIETPEVITQIEDGILLYAIWTPKQYSISYAPGVGDGNIWYVDTTVSFMLTIDLLNYDNENLLYSHLGHDFTGWLITDYASQTPILDEEGNQIFFAGNSQFTYNIPNDICFVAQWTPKTYTIKYNSNGGTGGMEDTAIKFDEEFTVPSTMFTKIGYAFANKWEVRKTVSDGENENIVTYEIATFNSYETLSELVTDLIDEGFITENETEIVLYAMWEANSYSITYFDNSNGDSHVVNEVKFNSEITIMTQESLGFTKTGYHIESWLVVTATDGKEVDELVAGNTATYSYADSVELYAVWKANQYKIYFNTLDGEIKEESIASANLILDETKSMYYKLVYFDSTIRDLPLTTKDGKNFLIWTKTENGTDRITSNDLYTWANDITIYASYENESPSSYEVDYYIEDLDSIGYTLYTTYTYMGLLLEGNYENRLSFLNSNRLDIYGFTYSNSELLQRSNGDYYIRSNYTRNETRLRINTGRFTVSADIDSEQSSQSGITLSSQGVNYIEYNVKFGATIYLKGVAENGYKLNFKETTSTGINLLTKSHFDMTNDNITIYAYGTSEKVDYTVEYYGIEYDGSITLLETVVDKAYTGENVNVDTSYLINGYSYIYNVDEILTGIVTGDGKLVLKVYYNVSTFNITLTKATNPGIDNIVIVKEGVEQGDSTARYKETITVRVYITDGFELLKLESVYKDENSSEPLFKNGEVLAGDCIKVLDPRDSEKVLYYEYTFSMVYVDFELKVYGIVKSDTPYTVNVAYEGLNGYDLDGSGNIVYTEQIQAFGATGYTVSYNELINKIGDKDPVVPTPDGFEFDRFQGAEIYGNGTTQVYITFKRIVSEIKINGTNNGIVSIDILDTPGLTIISNDNKTIEASVKYGANITLTWILADGYNFSAWVTEGITITDNIETKQSTFTMEDFDLDITLTAEPGEVEFAIEYYIEDFYNDSITSTFILYEGTVVTNKAIGIIDTIIEEKYLKDEEEKWILDEIEGFTYSNYEPNTKIAFTGTVLKVYYTRNVYTLTANVGKGFASSALVSEAYTIADNTYIYKDFTLENDGFIVAQALYGSTITVRYVAAEGYKDHVVTYSLEDLEVSQEPVNNFDTFTLLNNELVVTLSSTPISYKVKFDINGGNYDVDESGNDIVMEDATFTYDEVEKYLPLNIYKKIGYSF